MNIVVCIKQVPPINGTNRINPDTLRIVREGVDVQLDTADEFGIETALQLVEAHGGEVTLLTMGPPRAVEALRRGMAMGADKAIHICDPALAGSDTLTTARVLAAAIKRVNPDLVLCSIESSDAYTGMVPGGIAQFLDLPQLTFAKKLSLEGRKVTIQRQIEGGYQTIRADLPAVVTVTASINTPRYPALKGIMQAKKKVVETLTAADLQLAAEKVGQAGAKERVLTWSPAQQRKAGVVIKDDGNAVSVIADFLTGIKAF